MYEQYIREENLIETVLSPSNRFKLTINYYKTKEGSWNYTKGIISRISDGTIIAEIPRNYPTFNHSFFSKDKDEWFQSGRTYMSQCFVNLDTGKIYDNPDEQINYPTCWSQVETVNQSGTLLVISECIWGLPYNIMFHDFADPSKGWPIIPYKDYNEEFNMDCNFNEYKFNWLDDDTLEYICVEKWCPQFNKIEDDLTYDELSQLPDDDESYEKSFIKRDKYRVVYTRKDGSICLVEKEYL